MNKEWQIATPISAEFRQQFPEIPEAVLQLLYSRGLTTQKQIDEFLNPDYSQDIHDPFLFKQMKKAVARIFQAIENDELIVIHGDYDADGVCASVILTSTLRELGAKHLDIFLPDRDLDGYGLNKNTVEILLTAGVKLLITCDCGISNKEEVAEAQNRGLDVIITDHHTVPPEPPPAYAIIHPKVVGETYPDQGLSGGAVAFKLAQALLTTLRRSEATEAIPTNNTDSFSKWLLDLVAISSVADMVPLLGESRTLTKYGLIVLNKTKRLGLRSLIEIAGLDKKTSSSQTISTHNIGFQLAPRLNAAGRMQHANTAYQLLLADDPIQARELARELNANNQERQKLTERMTSESEELIEVENQKEAPVIFVLKEGWPLGLVGLVASRLCDRYFRPAMVLTKKDDLIHGSGRSIDQINIIEKMEKLKDCFVKYGGHPQACGFTLKEGALEKFKTGLTKLVADETKGKESRPALLIDAEINLDEVDWELYDLLEKFEPFGEANPEPAYLARGLTVTQTKAVGNEGQHLQLWVKHQSEKTRKMIGFCFNDESKVGANWRQLLKLGDKIDAVFQISANEWNGNRELQLKIVDLKLAS